MRVGPAASTTQITIDARPNPASTAAITATSGLSPERRRAVWSVTIVVAIVAVYGDATISRV